MKEKKSNPYGPATDCEPYFTEKEAAAFVQQPYATLIVAIEALSAENCSVIAGQLHRDANESAAGLPEDHVAWTFVDRIGYYWREVETSSTANGRTLAIKSQLILRQRLRGCIETSLAAQRGTSA